MIRRLRTVAVCAALFLLGSTFAQDSLRITLVTPNGTAVPFTLGSAGSGSNRAFTAWYYSGGGDATNGIFYANVGGTRTAVPLNMIARADLVSPGTATVWRFTLKDGRVLDGFVDGSPQLYVEGTNEFGARQSLVTQPRDPSRQPFISVIFDPAATAPGQATTPGAQLTVRADADNVNLRNGDILSGTILTTEFTIQASYGTLTFSKDQLQSITVENVAGKTDQVLLKVGDRVSGVLQNPSIQMTLTSGATITLEKGNIASITFARQE